MIYQMNIVPNMSLGFDEEFSRLITTEYRIQSPEITKREKVATCLLRTYSAVR